jgi:hypothetical protein
MGHGADDVKASQDDALRERLIVALCTDHGHADRPGSMACRTCGRRVKTILRVFDLWLAEQATEVTA